MALARVIRWAAGRQQRSAPSLLTKSESELSAWLASVAAQAGVTAAGQRTSRGALSEAATFQPWSEANQRLEPSWPEFLNRGVELQQQKQQQGTTDSASRVDVLRQTVLGADGVAVAAGDYGFGLVAEEPFGAGATLCHVPLCSAITLLGSPDDGIPAVIDRLLRLTNTEAIPVSVDQQYHRELVLTLFDRPPRSREEANLPLQDHPAGSEAAERQESLFAWWKHTLESKDHDWDETVVAGSIAMSRVHGLGGPYRCGILPMLHNANHSDEPNAVLLASSHTVDKDGVLAPGISGQFHRALVLSVAAREAGIVPTADEWQLLLAEPAVDLVAMRPIAPGEAITISYLDLTPTKSGEPDTAESIARTFSDNYGFVPKITDPAEARKRGEECERLISQAMRQRVAVVANEIVRRGPAPV
jgi:hypothetical protein